MHFVHLQIITFMSLEFIVSKYKVLSIHKYQENWCIAICNLLRLQLELHGCETGVGGGCFSQPENGSSAAGPAPTPPWHCSAVSGNISKMWRFGIHFSPRSRV